MSEPKYKCRIDLWIRCENQDAVSKLRELFVEKSGSHAVGMVPHRENTVVLFPLFHDLSNATRESHQQYSCAVEGNIKYTPAIDDFLGFIYGITHGNPGVYELRLEYFCPEEHGYGAWAASRTGIDWQYISSPDWPKDIACKECAKTDNYLDSVPCGTCEAKLRDMLRTKGLHYQPSFYDQCLNFAIGNYKTNLENKEKNNMDMDKLDRPNLNKTTDKEKAQIFDALSNISCIDTDLIVKLNLSDAVLRKVVRLANCLMAIFFGDPGDELSQIDDLSDNLKELNQATSNLNETLDSIRGEE